MNFRYVRMKSLTWWAGALMILVGVLQLAGVSTQINLAGIGEALAALTGGGDSSPAALIGIGAGLIGVRDKMERHK